MRRWLDNPRNAARFALGLLLLGGIIAGSGTLIRDLAPQGTAQWTFLFDTVGLIVALVGGIRDFQVQLLLEGINPSGPKRRGLFVLLVGLSATVGGCWLLGWVVTGRSQPILQMILAAVMTSGFGAVIDGFLHIGWFSSGNYLERRIAQRAEEEW